MRICLDQSIALRADSAFSRGRNMIDMVTLGDAAVVAARGLRACQLTPRKSHKSGSAAPAPQIHGQTADR
jgi:hypothetical protein